MTQSTVNNRMSGHASVSWLNEWTLYTTWSGVGTASLVAAAELEVAKALEERPLRYLFCDTRGVIGYDRTVHAAAKGLITTAKRRGMTEMIVVANPGAIRMLGFALGLLAKVRTRVMPDVQSAIEYCDRRPSSAGGFVETRRDLQVAKY